MWLTSLSKLTPIKALQFALEVELWMGRTVSPSQNNNGLTPLPTVYTLRDKNIFRLNLQSRHKKVFKSDDEEIETDIWNETTAEEFHGGYRAKRHGHILQHLGNITDKRFKHNLARRFVCYMVDAYGISRSVWQGERRKEGEIYLEAVLESL